MNKYLQYDRDNEIHYYAFNNKVVTDIKSIRLEGCNVVFLVKSMMDTRTVTYTERLSAIINGRIAHKDVTGQGTACSKDYYIELPNLLLGGVDRHFLSDLIERQHKIIPLHYK